jgi:hypothetical protein
MTRTRPRGLASWAPTDASRELVAAVNQVLDDYEAQLPLTLRQVFYRLVATTGYGKTEQAYERLGETVNRARRALLIPFSSIRDDGTQALLPYGFGSAEDFLEWARNNADTFEKDRQEGQERYLEVWVEAAGMAPMVARVSRDEYGVPVYSSGGFDSVTAKYQAAERMLDRDISTTVLHIGDYDPSGVALFEAAAEDVGAMYRDLDAASPAPEFVRVAVLGEHIDQYGLETAPPKKTDKRATFTDTRTVQAEAFAPDQLQQLVRSAIEARFDLHVYAQVLELEGAERGRLNDLLDELGSNGDGRPWPRP